MRIMLDTNVIISIIIFNSKTLKDLLIKINDNYNLVLSSVVIDELYSVINEKFPSKTNSVNIFLNKLKFELYKLPIKDYYKNTTDIRDKTDLPVLNSAIKSKVDIFITGDKDFLDISIKKPIIITPSDFLKQY